MRLSRLSENGHGLMDKIDSGSIEGISKKQGENGVDAAPVSKKGLRQPSALGLDYLRCKTVEQ